MNARKGCHYRTPYDQEGFVVLDLNEICECITCISNRIVHDAQRIFNMTTTRHI